MHAQIFASPRPFSDHRLPSSGTLDRTGRFLILGAGPVGLAVARAFSVHHVAYDHVDANEDLGGIWYHGAADSARLVSSRVTTEYADFPMPRSYPNFPDRQHMLAYLRAYAIHFNLRQSIEFQTSVVRVCPVEADLWKVTFASGEHRIYKGVVVCNGHHWAPRWPTIPGAFNGEIFHAKAYREVSTFRDRRVLVIGAGNSACDIATAAATVACSVSISVRRGHWFLPKTFGKVPTVELFRSWLPTTTQRALLRALLATFVGDYQAYGLSRPEHALFEAHPVLNDELFHCLRLGLITPRGEVTRYDGDLVHFADGLSQPFDTIVCATGYHLRFPFLPPGLVPTENNVPSIYGASMLPDYKNLYIIGAFQPRYGFGPLITPSADLLARVIQHQDNLVWPVGALLRDAGQKPPRTALVDPFHALRLIRLGTLLLPLLRPLDRRAVRRRGQFRNRVVPLDLTLRHELQVAP